MTEVESRLRRYSSNLPDLIVNVCPLGCYRKCRRIWMNSATGHRIICSCNDCHGALLDCNGTVKGGSR